MIYLNQPCRFQISTLLVKHLQVHWQHGEQWFWDTLLDADPASNAAGWQWVAGSGADAAPYFRIFNPVTQGRKFDPKGDYVRRWCPELSSLDTIWIHAPWEAPSAALRGLGVRLGSTYPHPIVEHSQARTTALKGYKSLKSNELS